MKAILLASALLVSGLALSPASAAPVAPLSVAAAVESPLLAVQYRRDRDNAHRDNRRYRAGQRYRSAPHGWHRYDRRPGDWRSRRCGQVGPVWFCP
jgi:hypothetical protein